MLTRTICLELAPNNITVNNIAPGAVHTPIDADVEADPEKMAALLKEIPLNRMAQPEEVAKLAAFLARMPPRTLQVRHISLTVDYRSIRARYRGHIMSIEIKVGPPVITSSQGRTFMVTDKHGYINTDSDQGVYAIDTRFISFYALAWATGSIFHMVRIILGLRADAPDKRLYVNPTLPDWLPEIELHHLQVGACSITLHFWREGKSSRWEVRDLTVDTGASKHDMIQVMGDPAKNGNV